MGDGGSKQLFVDGKLVGEVPITGNLEKDLEAATELMKAKGVYRQLTAPQVMFGQAAAFAGTAAHLFNNDLLQVPRCKPGAVRRECSVRSRTLSQGVEPSL